MDDLAFLKQPEVRDFILANLKEDVQKLIFNPPAVFRDRINLIADQIISRKKLKEKLPEWLEADVVLPPPLSIEQSSSAETASYKARIFKGDHLVDLTGGMGVDTLALSHSFKAVTYVENNPWLCRLFEYNQQHFADQQIAIHQTQAETFVNEFSEKASFFIDPSRRAQSQKVFLLEDCEPNIIEMIPVLKLKAKEVLIKVSPMMDITQGIRQLEHVKAVHVVSVKNECKEVLFHLDFTAPQKPPEIICVNLKGEEQTQFRFTFEQEQGAQVSYGGPMQYLYDPNSAILKAGAFKSVAVVFGLTKISRHTHLYTADQLIEDFPGRCFEVIREKFKVGEFQKLLPGNQANVVTKNYPLKAEALKKKLKIKDGGDYFIIGSRDHSDHPMITLCRRVN